jgi:hypothetical protein
LEKIHSCSYFKGRSSIDSHKLHTGQLKLSGLHVIAVYIRQVWDKSEWIYEGQHGFRTGYTCERQRVTACQDISDSQDGARIYAITIDFSYDRLLTKIAASGVDARVVLWLKRFLLGHSQRVRVGGKLS